MTWDYAYYWGVLCQFFFQQRLTDVALFTRLATPLADCEALNRDMQLLLRRAAGASIGTNAASMIDQQKLPWFAELNRGLRDTLDSAALEQRIIESTAMLRSSPRKSSRACVRSATRRSMICRCWPRLATNGEPSLLREAA